MTMIESSSKLELFPIPGMIDATQLVFPWWILRVDVDEMLACFECTCLHKGCFNMQLIILADIISSCLPLATLKVCFNKLIEQQ